MRAKNIAFLPANRDGCALWRMFLPHLNIDRSKFIYSDGKFPLERFIDCDVAIIQRLSDEEKHANAVGILHAIGAKVIYDLDDNLWDIPKWNPGARYWTNMAKSMEAIISVCDAMTVSTETLRKAVFEHFPRVRNMPFKVIPNAVDWRYFPERPGKRKNAKEFVIGWAGTKTHEGDIRDVFNEIVKMLDKHPDIVFEITTAPKDVGELPKHPRVRPQYYVPMSLYPAALAQWNWDLFLAPLAYNKFNRSKSNIKILEAAAVGSPILVSNVGPYREFVGYDKKLEFLACDDPKEWCRKIVQLKDDREMRDELLQSMRKVAKQHFDARDAGKAWTEFAYSL